MVLSPVWSLPLFLAGALLALATVIATALRFNISRRKRGTEERYGRIVQAAPVAIFVERGARVVFGNQAACNLVGAASSEQLAGLPSREIFQRDYAELGRLTTHLSDESVKRLDGKFRDVEADLSPFDDQGQPAILVVLKDVTAQKDVERKVVYDTLHDPLTGLPNRRLFLERLEHRLSLYHRHARTPFAVASLDVDCFRIVNDSLGYGAGNELLIDLTERLLTCIPAGDTLARIGGDEFAILTEAAKGPVEAHQTARAMQAALARPFRTGEQEFFITASIGITMAAESYRTGAEMLGDSITAMHKAKAEGRGREVFFDQNMHRQAVERMSLESDLRRAVDQGQFKLLYQPVIELATGKIETAEALLRWVHPSRGVLRPEDFLSVAEETGALEALNDWVLREACVAARGWNERIHPANAIPVSVNFAPRHFANEDFVKGVETVLSETGFQPSLLRLEIIESALLNDIDASVETIRALNQLGVEVDLDDFGTGYSSLSLLSRLPLGWLKIDRSFIGGIESSLKAAGVVSNAIALAHSLSIRVVAEGVERAGQVEMLKSFRCNAAQGYYFAEPVDESSVAGWANWRST